MGLPYPLFSDLAFSPGLDNEYAGPPALNRACRLRMLTKTSGSDTVSEPEASWNFDGISGSVESLNDRTIDREPGAPEWFASRAGDQAVLHEGKNLKFFAHLTPKTLVDGIRSPLK